MTVYVRVGIDNTVLEILDTDVDIKEMFHPSIKWDICTQPDVRVGFENKGGVYYPKTKTIAELSLEELSWRDSEIIRADNELNKVQDSDPNAVGTVASWRSYRIALRALTNSPKFPSESARPLPPDKI